MFRFAKRCFQSFRTFYSILIIGLLLLFISEHYHWPDLAHHMLRDIGISLIIAFCVIITIEQAQRQELNEFIRLSMSQTHTHLFQTIYGVEFPKKVWDFIRDRIMRESFFRVDAHVVYTIAPSRPEAYKYGLQTVTLEAETTQLIKNLTGRTLDYEAKLFVEVDPSDSAGGQHARTPSVEVYVDGAAATPEEKDEADKNWLDTPDFSRYNYKITIRPGQSRKIKALYRVNSKLIADTEVWRSLYTCENLHFTIKFPNTLSVSVDNIHADPVEYLHRSDTMIACRIREPLLPQNGFMFWWTPKAVIGHASMKNDSGVPQEDNSATGPDSTNPGLASDPPSS